MTLIIKHNILFATNVKCAIVLKFTSKKPLSISWVISLGFDTKTTSKIHGQTK